MDDTFLVNDIVEVEQFMQPLMEQPPKAKSFKVETPMVTLESDSGNHLIDIATVFIAIILLYFIFGRKRNRR